MSILEIIDYCVFCRAKECDCDPREIEKWRDDTQKYYDAIRKRYNECSWCKRNKQKMNSQSFACGHFQCKIGRSSCDIDLAMPAFLWRDKVLCGHCFYRELDHETRDELLEAEMWTLDRITEMNFPFCCKDCNQRLYGQGQRTIIHICRCEENEIELCKQCYYKRHVKDEKYKEEKMVKVFRSC